MYIHELGQNNGLHSGHDGQSANQVEGRNAQEDDGSVKDGKIKNCLTEHNNPHFEYSRA